MSIQTKAIEKERAGPCGVGAAGQRADLNIHLGHFLRRLWPSQVRAKWRLVTEVLARGLLAACHDFIGYTMLNGPPNDPVNLCAPFRVLDGIKFNPDRKRL